ncbi:hypothetical protein RJ639_018197 [Escallonia herrerae]|uniref:Uncharacterized protein n=1 Tax=Escallonia herrerae TaxID=1293975 RepID=A0AA88V7P6_9ASTE|nr:hypothetical protein RJ639_018197 [Escallonia herrerae]
MMIPSVLQGFLFEEPPSIIITAMSVVTFMFLSYLGISEITGNHLQYSKFWNVGPQKVSAKRQIKLSSRTGMLILYTPAFLAGLASFAIYPDGGFRYVDGLQGVTSLGNGDTSVAIGLLENLGERYFAADIVVHSMIIDSLCKDFELFSEVGYCGINPDIVTYKSSIHGPCNAERWNVATELLDDMVDRNIEPDDFTIFADSTDFLWTPIVTEVKVGSLHSYLSRCLNEPRWPSSSGVASSLSLSSLKS